MKTENFHHSAEELTTKKVHDEKFKRLRPRLQSIVRVHQQHANKLNSQLNIESHMEKLFIVSLHVWPRRGTSCCSGWHQPLRCGQTSASTRATHRWASGFGIPRGQCNRTYLQRDNKKYIWNAPHNKHVQLATMASCATNTFPNSPLLSQSWNPIQQKFDFPKSTGNSDFRLSKRKVPCAETHHRVHMLSGSRLVRTAAVCDTKRLIHYVLCGRALLIQKAWFHWTLR